MNETNWALCLGMRGNPAFLERTRISAFEL